MCGITGVLDTRGLRPVSYSALQRMNNSQLHRGPDEGSLHIEPGLGFGHRRLSIIDIATGQQPLFKSGIAARTTRACTWTATPRSECGGWRSSTSKPAGSR